MSRVMPVRPQYLRAMMTGRPVGVDRQNNAILGYVVAQTGPFKTAGRGEFDDKSLQQIVALERQSPKGLKSRLSHPTASSDGVGKFLGRSRDYYLDGDRVRGNLFLDPSSFNTPNGNLGGYILDLAESDPDALSSSLVLKVAEEYRLDAAGRKLMDDNGDPLPPLWRPTALHASDIVDTGDAVDGLLSAGINVDGLPLSELWQGCDLLDQLFDGQPREVVESRCLAFLQRYLDQTYGSAKNSVDILRRRLLLARKHVQD